MDSTAYKNFLSQHFVSIVKSMLHNVNENGFTEESHLYITFDTRAANVVMPESIRGIYPELMSVILQNRYKNLHVDDNYFSVQLSFKGIFEELCIPYQSIHTIADHSVQFLLQFPENIKQDSAEKDNYLSENKHSDEAIIIEPFKQKNTDKSINNAFKNKTKETSTKKEKDTLTKKVKKSDNADNKEADIIDISQFHKP